MKGLDKIGAELERSVRVDAASRRWGAWWRAPLLALVVVMGAGGIAAAASVLIGDPFKAPRNADVRAEPRPEHGQLAGLAVADPDGGPVWDLRLGRGPSGEVCTAVGQVVQGRLGVVGLDGVFRELPLGAGDTCSRPPSPRTMVAGARVFLGRDAAAARTVVAGRVGDGVRRLTVRSRAGLQAVNAGSGGAFAAVLPGYPEDLRPVVETVDDRGVRRTLAFADTGRDEVADVDGGATWAIEAEPYTEPGAPAGLSCAQAALSRDPTLDGPLTPVVCGLLERDDVYLAVRRFVPSGKRRNGTPWGLYPSRTLIFGAVSRKVRSVTVRSSRVEQRPQIFRPGGGFLVVLDGREDPRGVTVSLTFKDGSRRELRGSQHLRDERGRPISPSAVPAWRSVQDARPEAPGPHFAIPVAGTVRMSVPITDPAGGAPWAIRAWKATFDPRTPFQGQDPPGPFVCAQVGPLVGGAVRQPLAGGVGAPLSLTRERDSQCVDDVPPTRPAIQISAYTSDPLDYEPGLRHVLVRGTYPGARAVQILGAGRPRTATLVAPGSFAALLDPEDVEEPLRARITTAQGRQVDVAAAAGNDPRPGQGNVDARTPDPDGAAPWAMVVGGSGGAHGITIRYGRLVSGRLVHVDLRDSSVTFGGTGSITSFNPTRDFGQGPLTLLVQAQPELQNTAPTAAQIQRRTLPGRTVVMGTAAADVVDLELRTPRDVRILRPTGPGRAYIAVYDGTFTGGTITVTARMTDGTRKTITQRQEVR